MKVVEVVPFIDFLDSSELMIEVNFLKYWQENKNHLKTLTIEDSSLIVDVIAENCLYSEQSWSTAQPVIYLGVRGKETLSLIRFSKTPGDTGVDIVFHAKRAIEKFWDTF